MINISCFNDSLLRNSFNTKSILFHVSVSIMFAASDTHQDLGIINIPGYPFRIPRTRKT